ncbi:hypothetical protein HD553DRAFT_333687 [Filobasidium floriforme]|uniref:uncharacterized protein n=1 Tax=Filobasidium floriforme TaxID=5210 RepID=UPI001E8DD81C|nr:uncharacterized protein HD553DRAFT_333687 [Filobasidium floriforme]KAH8089096.1 hypothetical protein HD553DRAFT_333687 [Filobasidium floriforme]
MSSKRSGGIKRKAYEEPDVDSVTPVKPDLSVLRRPISIALFQPQICAWPPSLPSGIDEMVKVSFGPESHAFEYPIDVLRLSSVLSDALNLLQPHKTMTMNIDEDPQIAIILFEILWSVIRPQEQTANLMLASQASDLVKLADKYNVSGPVHTAYTLLIMQAEDRGYLKTIQSAALAYAANSRDPWLCHYVASRLQMGDPANWQRCVSQGYVFDQGPGISVGQGGWGGSVEEASAEVIVVANGHRDLEGGTSLEFRYYKYAITLPGGKYALGTNLSSDRPESCFTLGP